MKLLLSGGSHRAGLGAIGAIGYLCWAEATDLAPDDRGRRDRWSDVDEIVSVSGGSMLNARLAAMGTDGVDRTMRALRAFRRALLTDRMRPLRTARRAAITVLLVVLAAGVVWCAFAALGAVPPDRLGSAPWSFLVGLALLPLTIGLTRRLIGAYLRDIADEITSGAVDLAATPPSPRRHVLCAAGLSSGVPYYFTTRGPDGEPFDPPWGAELTTGYTLADAAMASGTLPGFGQIRAPRHLRRELLVDGGVSGSFGEQTSTSLRRRPEDTWRSSGDWFAIDAVRHLRADSERARRIRQWSLVAIAFRWLKVSLEATYVNDLLDLGPGQYARVWTPNPIRPGSPQPSGEEAALRTRLAAIQADVAELALTGFDTAAADAAVVAGFVSTIEVRRGLCGTEVVAGLAWLDDQLDAGGQLVAVWESTAGAVAATSASKPDVSSGPSESTKR